MVTNNIFGFQFSENKDGQQKHLLEKHIKENDERHRVTGNQEQLEWDWLINLFSQTQPHQIILTSAFVNAAQLIKVKDNWELDWLINALPHKELTQFNFGNSFIRWRLEGCFLNFLFAHQLKSIDNQPIYCDALQLDLSDLPVAFPSDTSKQTGAVLLLQLLIFWILGDMDVSILQPGQKFKTKRDPDGVINKTNAPVIVLDSVLYAGHIAKNEVKWTLHHYAAPGINGIGRLLEKRPNTLAT